MSVARRREMVDPDRKLLDARRQREPVNSAARKPHAGGLPRVARWRAVRRDLAQGADRRLIIHPLSG